MKTFTRPLLLFGFISAFLLPSATHAQRKRVVKKSNQVTVVRTYKTLPSRGARVKVVPTNSMVVVHKRVQYRMHNGVFYKPLGNQFVIATAPVGLRITRLPVTYTTIIVGRKTYFYHYGTYYKKAGRTKYQVVAPPIGAQVDTLPQGYETVENGGHIYYRIDSIHYKIVTLPNGNTRYQVVRLG